MIDVLKNLLVLLRVEFRSIIAPCLHKGVSEELLSKPFLVLLANRDAFGCLHSQSFHFCRNNIVSAVPVCALTEQLIKIKRIVKIRFMLAHFFFFSFQTWNNSKTVANTIALTR